MESDMQDAAALGDGGGASIVTVPFDAGQVPPGEIADLNHDCPDGSCGGVGVFPDAGPDAGPVTTISGTIYDPGVNVPLPNIVVYQPSGAVTVPSAGVSCDTCSSLLSPALASTSTDVNGKFTLQVTGTTNIPIVIQTGKWQRQVTVVGPLTAGVDNPQAACTPATAPGCLWRLPRSGSAAGAAACGANCASAVVPEGHIPLIALATGDQEPFECSMAVFMGGANGGSWEMGPPSSGKRIQLFKDSGSDTSPGAPGVASLYASQAAMNAYDVVLLPCAFAGSLPTIGAPAQGYFVDFTESGGKLFIDHHDGDALVNAARTGIAPFKTTATWMAGDGITATSPALGKVLGADAPHTLFRQWLTNVGAYGGGVLNTPTPRNEALIPNVANTFEWVWGQSGNAWNAGFTNSDYTLSYSFDLTAAGVTAAGTTGCGRVVYNNMHVDTSRGATSGTFPGTCNFGTGLSANEQAFDYLLFELSGCSVTASPVPTPPPPSGCEAYQVGGSAQAFYACQMDTYCDPLTGGGTGECIPFSTGQTWAAPAPAPREGATSTGGVDLTVEQGCSIPEGGPYYQYVPICNRGTATLTPAMSTTGKIALSTLDFSAAPYNAAPFDPPGPCPTVGQLGAPACEVAIPAAGLAGGQCLLLNVDTDCAPVQAAALGYDQLLFVNSDYAITEDSLQPSALLSTQSVQPGCADNWGILSDNNNPPACSEMAPFTSQTTTFTYSSSTCPVGTHGQWALLTYNATVGVGATALQTAEVLFQVATQPVLADGGTGPLTSFVTVADVKGVFGGNNLADPAVCTVGGPAATTPAGACSNGNGNPSPPCCPKSIAQALELPTPTGLGPAAGVVADDNTDLTLKITINPSPDGTQTATVANWQVSFDCVPSE
jgi:hypothetical protein